MANAEGWRPSGRDPQSGAPIADWRKGQAQALPGPRRRWRVGVAFGLFLAVCAGFLWLTMWLRPPQPGRLLLFGAGYDTNLLVPENTLGLGGLKQLAAFAEKADLLKPAAAGLVELRSNVAWEETLERLKEPMLVLAISAQGGKDARGPYLLPHDTDLRDSPPNDKSERDRHRIRPAEILDQLAKLPSHQKKLLILDAAFMPSHAALGMLHNDFARGVADLEKRILEIPNLVVICSTSPDELSWASPEWGSTAFAHFLIEGLHGLADEEGNGDHRVDAFELWNYTRANVSRWTAINRSAEQTPMLLPKGEEGERRASHILLSLVDRKHELSPPEEKPDLTAPLKAAWEKWAALRDRTPAPAVYAPSRWQKYQAGVLRVEQLLRNGDADGAQRMQADLDRWEAELRQEADLPAPSLRQTWALARSEIETKIDESLDKSFQKLWDAPNEEEAQKFWDDWLKEAQKNPAVAPPRLELARLILDRVAQEPKDIEKAGQRLRLIRDGNAPFSPEAHFALMLSRDAPANPPAAEFATTLPLALKVRRLAEKTPLAAQAKDYSYSERLDPWIGRRWLEVDRDREFGQDLLLSGSAADWKNGHDQLKKAEAGYLELQTDAELVRKAFAVRDRVQALLPFYLTWALNKTTPDADLDKALIDVASDAHALDAALARAGADLLAEKLAEKAEALAEKWSTLEARHQRHAQQVRAASTVNLDDARLTWRDTEAVLAVPFAERLDLVARQAKLSSKVLIEGQPLTAPPLSTTATKSAKDWGKRFGAFALARFGPAWFDRWTKPGAETFTEVSRRLDRFSVEQKWWESLDDAGEQVGQRVVRMNDEIRRLTALDPKASLAESRAALQDADRIVRLADAQTFLTPGKLGPATMFRAWLTAELLARQSQRTWQDHWFDDNPAAEPYFRTICRGYQLDTASLVASLGSPNVWKQSLKEWDQKLQAPGELVLVDVTGRKTDPSGRLIGGGDRFAVLTSETSLEREYRLQPSSDKDQTPGGGPVVWVESFQGLTPLEPRERQRVVLPVDPDRTKLEDAKPLQLRFTSPLVQEAEEKNLLSPIQRTSLVFKGLFRGQQIGQETRVEVQPTADIIVRQLPMPNKASVAVRTRRDTHTKVGSAQGAIAFVLDASGSMRPTNPAYPEKSRYFQAVSALSAILRKLPKDTQVSVWTFGQAMGVEKTVDRAEDSIVPILPPTAWDPQNPKQLSALLGRLAYPAVEPWNESPIARTLLKAKGDLAGAIGYKTIVTITDGGDNRFDKDVALKARSKNLTQFFRDEFDKGDIALNFVAFPPLTPDENKAIKELKSTESLSPAGKVYAISETGKLIEALESLLKQRLNYYVDYQGKNVSVDGTPERGLDVSPGGANYRWFGKGMTPGGHKLHVDVAGRVEKNILLHPGDLLLADLVDTPTGYAFERFLFSSEFPWKRSLENGKRDWKMTVLQNQLGPRKDLEMLVSLEKTVDRRETLLEQIKPRDAWVEVTPAADQGPAPPLHWSYLAGFPAPAWAVQAPAWPAEAAPKVQVWWNPDEEARSAADLVLGDVLQDRDRPVFLPGEPPLTLESISFEKHYAEVQPGVLAAKMCLVVRLKHAPGRPVIARLQGLTPAGSEQRLYTQADKTASLFWFEPDIEPKARMGELAVSRLRLISIAAFKEEARRRDYWLEIRDLGAPDPADERPRPPLDLK
jgi:hypothetical protein